MYVPKRGPRTYNAIAAALSRSANISAMAQDPPPIATPVLPEKPPTFDDIRI
jgi:hypothetical protein